MGLSRLDLNDSRRSSPEETAAATEEGGAAAAGHPGQDGQLHKGIGPAGLWYFPVLEHTVPGHLPGDFLLDVSPPAQVWEGLNVVKTGRVMLGETNPADSKPGTIRGDFCIQVGR